MKMISMEEALAIVDQCLARISKIPTEVIETGKALGRILAEAQTSQLNLPPFDKSAMDGYAVLKGDKRDFYKILEFVPAGRVPTQQLQPGCVTKVMTGAPVPEGSERVIMHEDTKTVGKDLIEVLNHSDKSNICKQGEDVCCGDVIMLAGVKLKSVRIANLISCGIGEVKVYCKPRVAILVTGDEIAASNKELQPGMIIDSNTPMLKALAEENCFEVTLCAVVPDVKATHCTMIEEAAEAADLILLSGGVSAGDFDFVSAALQETGFTIHFDQVAMQPGKPLTFATRNNIVALGLPGNPVSVLISFHLFARRIASCLCGTDAVAKSFAIPVASKIERKNSKRAAFRPCVIDSDGAARVLPYHGSAHLMAISNADGFIKIPAGVASIPAGGTARFFPLTLEK